MNRLKSAITLILLVPILMELIAESTPLPAFIAPSMLTLFIIGYGVMVLLIRELIVGARFGIAATLFVGFAYGVFNEGLIAHTLIHRTGLPIGQLDNYGYALGVSFPWTVVICLWHAVGSVLLPILIVHRLFPAERDVPWLNKYAAAALAAFLLSVASLGFIDKKHPGGSPSQLAVLLGLMAACVVTAIALPRKRPAADAPCSPSIRPLLLGMSILFFNVVVQALGRERAPLVLFYLALAIMVASYIVTLRRNGWLSRTCLLLFGVGCYLESTLLGTFTIVAQGPGNLVGICALVTGIAATIILIRFAIQLLRKHGESQ